MERKNLVYIYPIFGSILLEFLDTLSIGTRREELRDEESSFGDQNLNFTEKVFRVRWRMKRGLVLNPQLKGSLIIFRVKGRHCFLC